MNRLTARAGNGLAYLAKVKDNEQYLEGSYNTLFCVREAFEKLADLEDGNFEERAIKAEALSRELARELEEIKKRGDWLKRDCTEPDKVIIYAIDINIIGNGTLAKAKEVLGDEA